MSDLLGSAADTGIPVSELKARTSDLKAPKSDLKAPKSEVKAPKSDLKAPKSELRAWMMPLLHSQLFHRHL
jgi:hypothetical protein